ncbi:MAG: tetratricopeptide repeat protein [Niabella sp.]|nr:MAG: tetratricopeptide repeat protein [Niabella sp.]
MREFQQHDEDKGEEINELIQRYENLRRGRVGSYIEEESFEKLIEHFELKEQYIKALQVAVIASEQYPYSSTFIIKKADLLLNRQSYEDALALLEQASVLDHNNIDIYILKTEALLALDRQEAAVNLLNEALDHFTGEEKVELLFELSDVYDDYEDFDKVFDCLKEILIQDPQNGEALYKICFWTDYTGRNAESIELHKNIIDEFPYNELAWFNLGTAFQGIKLYEKAIDAYKYALVIDEKMDYAYRNIGDAYIRLRRYKDAIENLEKVIELSKPEDVIYEAIGYCYEKMKNFAQARFYYRKASHLNQDVNYLTYKIANTYYKEEKYVQCIKLLESAIKQKWNKADYYFLLGDCKKQIGQMKEAIVCFSNVVRLKPRSTTGWEALIKCLYEDEQYDEALVQLEHGLLLAGEKAIFEYLRALLLFSLGKTKEALLQLEIAMVNAPSLIKKLLQINPSILLHQQVSELILKYKKQKRK